MLDEEFVEEDVDLSDDPDGAEGGEELYEHYRIVADRGQTLMRVDKFLMEHMPGTSRNRIQKAAEAGAIQVNGRPVKSNYRIKPFEVVTLMLDRPRHETVIEPEDLPLDVVYEDDDLMVVNKPAGMVVHPGCGNYHGTLINAIAWHLKDDPRFDANDPNVGLCHRIDKDTSGLLVVAKTADAKTHLCRQFFNKSQRFADGQSGVVGDPFAQTTGLHREYTALVWGPFQENEGTVRGAIARNPSDRLQMTIVPDDNPTGKHAVTHYRVIERFGYVTLVACVLETGRTHQIRVHMKSIGHTLFADMVYGGDEILRGERTAKYKQFIANCLSICPRQALHARTLGFIHPTTGQQMDFSCPIPADISDLLDKWRTYVFAQPQK